MHKTYTISQPYGETDGRFFWEASPFADPGICFVPESLIDAEGKLKRSAYLNEGWARLNCGSQPQGRGSHMFPDMETPVLGVTPEAISEARSSTRECLEITELKQTIYERPNLQGKLAVTGERVEKEGTPFFRKTYDLEAIEGEGKQSTVVEAEMTEIMGSLLPDESYFPKVIDSGADCIETEFIPGQTIASILRISSHTNSKYPNFEQNDATILREVWNALEESDTKVKRLHAAGMLHQDLHLDNIMIVNDQAGSHAVFIDFEKSKAISDSATAAGRQIDFDRRFILQAALLIGLRMEAFRESPLFEEAFEKRKPLFREFKDMNLEACRRAMASPAKEGTTVQDLIKQWHPHL